MHELGIARTIFVIVGDAAHGRKVRRVTLEVVALSSVMTDAIAFCFSVVHFTLRYCQQLLAPSSQGACCGRCAMSLSIQVWLVTHDPR
jgi:Zn finger protein HypA/HybF involved in hydrogenase expression